VNAKSNSGREIPYTSQGESKQISVKEEEDPLLMMSPFIKAEDEVSRVSLLLSILKMYRNILKMLLPECISQIKRWFYFHQTATFCCILVNVETYREAHWKIIWA
jgi:hypothetical protein